MSEYAWFGLGYLAMVMKQYPVKSKLVQNKNNRAVLLISGGKILFLHRTIIKVIRFKNFTYTLTSSNTLKHKEKSQPKDFRVCFGLGFFVKIKVVLP